MTPCMLMTLFGYA